MSDVRKQVERSLPVHVAKADDELRIAWGVVLEPRTVDDPDAQGDWYTADTIRKAAHGYLAKGSGGADLMHDETTAAGIVVESWIAQSDQILGDEVVKAGSWCAGIHYPDADIWSAVKKGEYAAFSVGGTGTRIYGSR